MVWPEGLQLLGGSFYTSGSGNKKRFAEQVNSMIMSNRGNKVVSGCDPTVGASTDLTSAGNHLNIASGIVIVDSLRLAFAGGNVDLSGAWGALSSPTNETRYVLITIYNNSSTATLRATSGTIAADGNQEPPEFPEDEVGIAIIYLNEADSVFDINQIGEWMQYTPDITLMADGKKSYWGSDGDSSINHSGAALTFSNSVGNFQIQALAGNVNLWSTAQVTIKDIDDSNVDLFVFDTSARTMTIGASADSIGITEYLANKSHAITRQANTEFATIRWTTTSTNDWAVGLRETSDSDFHIFSYGTSSDIITLTRVDGKIKNPVDDAGYHTGASDEFRMYETVGGISTLSKTNAGFMHIATLGSTITDGVKFLTDGTSKFFIRGDGNVGFNSTDVEAWTSFKVIEGQKQALVFGDAANEQVGFWSNMWYDGSFKFKQSNIPASQMFIDEDVLWFRYDDSTSHSGDAVATMTNGLVLDGGAKTMVIGTSGDNIDSAFWGWLSIHESVKSWHANFKGIQMRGMNLFVNESNNQGIITFNAFYDSNDVRWEFVEDGYTSKIWFDDDDGLLKFDYGGIGSANGAITWNTALTIDESGNTLFSNDLTNQFAVHTIDTTVDLGFAGSNNGDKTVTAITVAVTERGQMDNANDTVGVTIRNTVGDATFTFAVSTDGGSSFTDISSELITGGGAEDHPFTDVVTRASDDPGDDIQYQIRTLSAAWVQVGNNDGTSKIGYSIERVDG